MVNKNTKFNKLQMTERQYFVIYGFNIDIYLILVKIVFSSIKTTNSIFIKATKKTRVNYKN